MPTDNSIESHNRHQASFAKDTGVSVAQSVVGYCDASETVLKSQYSVIVDNIAHTLARCVIDQRGKTVTIHTK